MTKKKVIPVHLVSFGISVTGDLDILEEDEKGQTVNYITVGSMTPESLDYIIEQLQSIKASLEDCPVRATHH
jgi:hypothetical protein